MELLLIKLALLVGSVVGTFLLGTLMIFITPYAFFGTLLFLLPKEWEDGWMARALRWCIAMTWKLHKLFLPHGIVLMLGNKKKH